MSTAVHDLAVHARTHKAPVAGCDWCPEPDLSDLDRRRVVHIVEQSGLTARQVERLIAATRDLRAATCDADERGPIERIRDVWAETETTGMAS